MIIAFVPALFCVLGLLMFGLCANGKLASIGFEMFRFSFLVLMMMMSFASKVLRLG